MTAVAGYHHPRWFVAGGTGFDKAMVSHFKHSAEFKNSFPQVMDGWDEPSGVELSTMGYKPGIGI